MREFELTTVIEAPPGATWEALVRLDEWPRWNRLIPSGRGELRVGAVLDLRMRSDRGALRPHRPTVVSVRAPESLELAASFGHRKLLHMVHGFAITDLGDGRSLLRQTWKTTGLLADPLWPMLVKVMERFSEMGEDLSAWLSRKSSSRGEIAVVGGGPSGMTAALLLARAGHRVVVYEKGTGMGGLWAAQLDDDGYFLGENSCKVFQSTYEAAPALLRMLGTRWDEHFTPRHDLCTQWLAPFLADASVSDLAKLGFAFGLHATGARDYKTVSVAEFLAQQRISEGCSAWMRATALGGITGTLRMTMWEFFLRMRGNLGSVLFRAKGPLHWNSRPPNARGGFMTLWRDELLRLGVELRAGCNVDALSSTSESDGVVIETAGGAKSRADAVFLAVPPPALSRLFAQSDAGVSEGFGHDREGLRVMLGESMYEHLGITWFFDRELPKDLPLGGHNVRKNWHPILVQHSQYRGHLRSPAVTVVVGSVSLDTDFVHEKHGTLASEHSPDELARILWGDERRADPTLPEPIGHHVYGMSNATQIVRHGPLPIKARGAPVYLATNLNGHAPYFTASLESAIQAGAAAAAAFDPRVEVLKG